MKREFDPNALVKGIEVNIYQARSHGDEPGKWHAHVSHPRGFSQDDVTNLPRPCSVTLRGSPANWIDCGYNDSEAEARTNAAMAVGHVYGRRLTRAMGPQKPPTPHVLAPIRKLTL